MTISSRGNERNSINGVINAPFSSAKIEAIDGNWALLCNEYIKRYFYMNIYKLDKYTKSLIMQYILTIYQ
jgi:hypothetical protein